MHIHIHIQMYIFLYIFLSPLRSSAAAWTRAPRSARSGTSKAAWPFPTKSIRTRGRFGSAVEARQTSTAPRMYENNLWSTEPK